MVVSTLLSSSALPILFDENCTSKASAFSSAVMYILLLLLIAGFPLPFCWVIA